MKTFGNNKQIPEKLKRPFNVATSSQKKPYFNGMQIEQTRLQLLSVSILGLNPHFTGIRIEPSSRAGLSRLVTCLNPYFTGMKIEYSKKFVNDFVSISQRTQGSNNIPLQLFHIADKQRIKIDNRYDVGIINVWNK